MWLVPIALVVLVVTFALGQYRARTKGASVLFTLMLGGLVLMYFIDNPLTFFVGGIVVLATCYATLRQCIVKPYSFRFMPKRARQLLAA